MNRRTFFQKLNQVIISYVGVSLNPKNIFADTHKTFKMDNNWFQSNRIQTHIRLPITELLESDSKLFTKGNLLLKNIGSNVITRHFKTAGEGAWWNTTFGKTNPIVNKTKKNIAKLIIDDAHQLNMSIIAYYRHMEDDYIATTYPSWLCKNWKGKHIRTITNRGYYICFNSPYKEFVKNRLIELVKLGIDGIYFDETHMPRTGCWCSYCQKKFKTMYKHNIPKKVNFSDPIWAKYYTEFTNQTIEETFLYWKESIKKENSEVKLIISLHLYPTFFDYFLSTNLMKIADSVKSEFDIPIKIPKNYKKYIFNPLNVHIDKEIKMALGYTLIRDASNSFPAHIWIPQAIDKLTMEYAIAGVISYGNIANININEKLLNTKNSLFYNQIGVINKKLQTIFSQTLPLKTIGIYYSERQRNLYIPNYIKSYENVINPVFEAYTYLFHQNLPICIYTDETLSSIDRRTKILFVPNTYILNKNENIILNNFIKNGGTVIYKRKNFSKNIESLSFPFEVISNKKSHITYFNSTLNNEFYIFIANEFSWIAKVKWRRWPQYLKKNLTYTLPSHISTTIKINKNHLSNIKNIEEIFDDKIHLTKEESLEFIHLTLKNISSLAIIKIQKL